MNFETTIRESPKFESIIRMTENRIKDSEKRIFETTLLLNAIGKGSD